MHSGTSTTVLKLMMECETADSGVWCVLREQGYGLVSMKRAGAVREVELLSGRETVLSGL